MPSPVASPLPAEGLRRQIAVLEERVKQLQAAIASGTLPKPLADALQSAATELSKAAGALKAAAEKLPAGGATVTLKLGDQETRAIDDIKRTLDSIKTTIDNVPPRRNVRSTSEGGRQ